jgi:hypothetical protein
MRITKLVLFTAFSLGVIGCADTTTSQIESELEDSCSADKAEFEDWAAVEACDKTNPGRVTAALEAIENAGGTCTATDDSGACSSIEPIKDEQTDALRRVRFVCWYEPYCDNKGNCDIRETCCIENGPFPFPEWICGESGQVLN